MKLYNVDSINTKAIIKTAPSGFKYGFVPDVFKEEAYVQLQATFPDVQKFKLVDKMSGGGHKKFYVGPVYSGSDKGCTCHLSNLPAVWKEALAESNSPEILSLLKETTGVQFNSLVNFGLAYGNETCQQGAHIDGAVRGEGGEHLSTLACILYFNEKPEGPGGTCVYATDRTTVLFQAPSLRNGLFFFEQHPDAWHGFPEMPQGSERRIVSLAYGQEPTPVALKTSFLHQITCLPTHKKRVKKLLKKFL